MGVPLLALAGPSGGGKTTLANYLVQRHLAHWRPVLLSLDRYYHDLSHLPPERRASENFDHPEALEWRLLRAHLDSLSSGKDVPAPVYDFASHTRRHHAEALRPGGLIVLEGLFALHKKVIDLVDFGVYVELSEDKSLQRRLDRDVGQRGRTQEDVLKQFKQSVGPMSRLHVLPTRQAANLVVNGEDPLEQSAILVSQFLEKRVKA